MRGFPAGSRNLAADWALENGWPIFPAICARILRQADRAQRQATSSTTRTSLSHDNPTYLAKLRHRSRLVAKTFARESPPPPIKLNRNHLHRAQDKECMALATSFFGRASIATRKCQTLTEASGFVAGQI